MAQPKPIKADFGTDGKIALEKRVKDQVDYIFEKTRKLREEQLPKWVRAYRGIPETEEAKFPWPGASNLIIQVAGTHCDELLSRVMAIWSDAPIYRAELYAETEDQKGPEYKEAIEQFMDKMAFEPTELDLFRVEETFFSNTIRYG